MIEKTPLQQVADAFKVVARALRIQQVGGRRLLNIELQQNARLVVPVPPATTTRPRRAWREEGTRVQWVTQLEPSTQPNRQQRRAQKVQLRRLMRRLSK